jgi:hypothetical protein
MPNNAPTGGRNPAIPGPHEHPAPEEPVIGNEDDIASDGTDPEGEQAIRNIPEKMPAPDNDKAQAQI